MAKTPANFEPKTGNKDIPKPGNMDKSVAQTNSMPGTAKSNRSSFQPKGGNKNIPKPGGSANTKPGKGASRTNAKSAVGANKSTGVKNGTKAAGGRSHPMATQNNSGTLPMQTAVSGIYRKAGDKC